MKECIRCKGTEPKPEHPDAGTLVWHADPWSLTIVNGDREMLFCLDCVEALFLALVSFFPYTLEEARSRALQEKSDVSD